MDFAPSSTFDVFHMGNLGRTAACPQELRASPSRISAKPGEHVNCRGLTKPTRPLANKWPNAGIVGVVWRGFEEPEAGSNFLSCNN